MTRRHVLTGAGSGIGLALAHRLAGRGDELVLLARSEARAAELARTFPQAQLLVADLADPGTLNGVGRLVDGPVDSVVHVAGVVDLAPVERLRLAEWEEQLTVNLTAPAVLTREMLPHVRAGRGTVVFVNSSAGLVAHADWSAYAASKSGLRSLADALRAEEAEHGVRVSTVYPSRTATPMQEKVHGQEGRDYDASRWLSPEAVADTILHVVDLPAGATIPDVTLRPVAPRPGS
ncbi:SDR family oxidoreductase [Nocardioides sp. zg-1228]|uniref:SDR family oxidoreductase n=1 Tax=Nocardioides sp. zg-1228 TaxID=2763008 RepID=UPI001642B6F7|nr:SDR family oxidoreductase [Nocardioides sp. zg-1228]MBC2934060.1 SDR family oxidoreductase [Nocardioides sp. zg-1228]QSF58813.1 SDR family oxidoreductase [Nocardioides sp. zg-1228]